MLGSAPTQVRFTYGDYLRWTGEERWELIGGQAFGMSPSPSRRHQEVVVALLAQIAPAVADSPCRVYVAPFDVRLPHANEADEAIDTVVQPDLVVVCDPKKLDERGCRGAPDWVIEVLSPATAARDQVTKRDLYERHAVGEYWIVDPDARTVQIHRLDPASGRYSAVPMPASQAIRPLSLPLLEIDWQAVFTDGSS